MWKNNFCILNSSNRITRQWHHFRETEPLVTWYSKNRHRLYLDMRLYSTQDSGFSVRRNITSPVFTSYWISTSHTSLHFGALKVGGAYWKCLIKVAPPLPYTICWYSQYYGKHHYKRSTICLSHDFILWTKLDKFPETLCWKREMLILLWVTRGNQRTTKNSFFKTHNSLNLL